MSSGDVIVGSSEADKLTQDDNIHHVDISRSVEKDGVHHIHEEEPVAHTDEADVSHDEAAGLHVSDNDAAGLQVSHDEAVHQSHDGDEEQVEPHSAATVHSPPPADDDHTMSNEDAPPHHHDHGRHADDYSAHTVGGEDERYEHEAGGAVESEHEDERVVPHSQGHHEAVHTEDYSHNDVNHDRDEDHAVQNGHDRSINNGHDEGFVNGHDEGFVNGHDEGFVNGHYKENGVVANGLLPRQDSLAGVDEILQSPAIRREIDEIIGHQMKLAPAANDLLAMQQLTDYLLPKSHGVGAGHIGKGAIIPIADVQGSDAINYVEGEQALRCKVAALHRLVDMFNWTRGFNSLLSCRISQEFEHFLVAPHGLLYSEVTAASLVRVDRQADILHAGTTTLGINHIAFKLHGALHASRPDLKCLIHLHNPTAVSVSVMTCGLLPLCVEAMELGETSFYDFPGQVKDDDEVDVLIRAFGPTNRVLIIRNFGILVGGVCVEDAFHSADSVMTACETQLRMIPLGLKSLKIPSVEEQKKVFDERNAKVPEGKRKFTKGMLEFEELMRLLDDAGYRTGYPYHPSRPGDEDGLLQDLTEVAAPPTATSFVYVEDRSRSKEKKPKVYAKDTETVTTTPQPRPIPAPHTTQVLNVQQLKERYREIRQQYYDTSIASRRETARQSKARSLSRGRKRDASLAKDQSAAKDGAPNSKSAEKSKQTSKTAPTSQGTVSSGPVSPAAAVEDREQATLNESSTSHQSPSRVQPVKHKAEEAENRTGEKGVSSPAKSTSSGEGIIDKSPPATPSKEGGEGEKKKKKGFSLPSFGKKDKEKKAAK